MDSKISDNLCFSTYIPDSVLTYKAREFKRAAPNIVSNVKTVVITKPSRFHPLLTEALNRVYKWLTRQGYDIKQFPISLPWQPIRIGAEQKIARENGRRCAAFVLEYFQSSEGPFEKMSLNFRNITDWDRPDNEELENLQDELQDTCNASVAQAKLKLHSLFGENVEIPGGTDGVYLDFITFINDFIKTCSIPMFERLQRLLQDSQLNDLNIYLLATGRGSFFPLVGSMLFAHQARINKNKSQKIEQVRVDRDYAKTIVSLGACHLANLPKVTQGIVFIPRTMPSFGVQGDLDPDTGKSQFIPLCAGIPTSADGWQIAAYRLRASNSQSFDFYFSADNKNIITDNDEHFGTVSGNISMDSTQAASAHIMIKAKEDNGIEVYIGFPTEDQINGKDYENWNKEFVGELTL